MAHDKIILLSTPFPTIPMLGNNCCCDVIVFYVGNNRYCIVDAAGVKAGVERAVESGLGEKMTVFNKKFVTIATDGAAVMTG